MDDLISRQAAIDALKSQLSDWNDDYNIPVRKSIENIERLPSAQPQQVTGKLNADCISRKAEIDLVKSRSYDFSEREDEWAMVQDVEELPSAQPKIIRCMNCRYYGYGACHYSIGREFGKRPDDFCSRAERR